MLIRGSFNKLWSLWVVLDVCWYGHPSALLSFDIVHGIVQGPQYASWEANDHVQVIQAQK